MVPIMLLVEIALVDVKIENPQVKEGKNLHDVMTIKLVVLVMMLSVKNLEKANQAVRSRINLQNVVNLRNLKVNVNDRGKYGKEIKSIPYC